jgi:archaellum biogenesis protein FlaJ (TadC family)
MATMISSIINIDYAINYTTIGLILIAITVVIVFCSALILKIIDGGSFYSSLVDFVIMVWIAVLIYLIVPGMMESVLPQSLAQHNHPKV